MKEFMQRLGILGLMLVLVSLASVHGIEPDGISNKLFLKADKVDMILDTAGIESLVYVNMDKKYNRLMLLVFAYYPELLDKNIDIIEKPLKSSLQVRPSAWSMFGKNDNRQYKIYIDTAKFNMVDIQADERFNAQAGAMGHELAHIIDYESKSNLSIIWMGLKYVLSPNYRKGVERNTDAHTASRGLGYQLLLFRRYIKESPNIPRRYKEMKKQFYLSQKELIKELAEVHAH